VVAARVSGDLAEDSLLVGRAEDGIAAWNDSPASEQLHV